MTLDVKELRRLAEGATPGKWHIDRHTTIDKFFAIYDSPNRGTEIASFDYDDVDHEQVDATAAFIAAASPSTMLALLDQLAAVTAARDSACNLAALLAGSSDAADERIAELREVGR